MSALNPEKAYQRALELLAHKHARIYPAGTSIFREGDIGDRVYFVLEGTVHIFTQQDGKRTGLNSLSEGEVFGELALLNQTPRSASVEAQSDVKVVELKPEVFCNLLEKYPALAMKMIHLMADRMYKINEQLKQELGYQPNGWT